MNVSTVLAGCLVLVLCAVNAQEPKCPDNLVLVIDCLDKNNAAQWTAVKTYIKYIIQHLPETETAGVSKVNIALVVADGREDGSNLVIPLNSSYATNKVAMMGFVNDIKTNRRDITLAETIGMFDRKAVIRTYWNVNAIVIIKDSSVPNGITTNQNDVLHTRLTNDLLGDPMYLYLIRIDDAAEDANVKSLMTWFAGLPSPRQVFDYRKSNTDLTHQDAYDFVKKALACPPVGSATDVQETVPTGITLPPPAPTEPTDHGETTVSSAQSLTKTSSRVVGLWMCVTIVTTAAVSTF